MPTLVDKDRSTDLLRSEFAAITALCSALTDDQWKTATCLPGWSVQDVLSHMVGTESMLSGSAPPAVDVSHLVPMKNPVAEANEVWVESMRSLGGPEVLRRWEVVTAGRLATLDGMSQADFDAPSWTPVGRDETYGRFMRIRHFDCYMHEHDIRFALGLPARAVADHQGSCLEEVATGLGYIVGRRAGLPDGSRVAIRLTGEPASHVPGPGGRTGLGGGRPRRSRHRGDRTAGTPLPAAGRRTGRRSVRTGRRGALSPATPCWPGGWPATWPSPCEGYCPQSGRSPAYPVPSAGREREPVARVASGAPDRR